MAVDWGAIQQQQAQTQQAQPQQQQQQAPASPEQMMQQAIQGDPSRLAQMAQFLTQGANLGYSGQEAQLGQARDAQIADLEKNYSRAVNDGELSVKEAERLYQEQVGAIHQNAYTDSERTQVMATDRGIGNSQQMMGMVAGDNARKNSLLSKTLTERDQRISTIKDRISQIGLEKNLDVGQANSNYDYALAGQKSQIGQGLLGQMFQMGNDDYAQRRQAQSQFAQMGMQNQYQLGQMDVQNQYQLGQMAVNQQYNLETMTQQQINLLEQFAVQHDYDITKMDAQQINTLAQMAKQNGYNIDMENLSSGNQFANQSALSEQGYYQDRKLNNQRSEIAKKEAETNAQIAIEQETKAYDLAVQRELAKYDPESKEYDILKGQLDTERQAMINELITQAQVEASIQYNLGTPIAKPVKPTKGRFETKNHHKKEMEDYDAQLEKFDAYQRALSDPMSMFPREADRDTGGAGSKW